MSCGLPSYCARSTVDFAGVWVILAASAIMSACTGVPTCDRPGCWYRPASAASPLPWEAVATKVGGHDAENLLMNGAIDRAPDGSGMRPGPLYSNDEARPEVCLALSGGGVRSAAFSIGVLSAFHAKRLLNRVAVISSVSGGGYAASWYYVQLYRQAQSAPLQQYANSSAPVMLTAEQRQSAEAAMFQAPSADAGIYQAYLRDNARMMTEQAGLPMVAGTALYSIPANLLLNMVLSERANVAVAAAAHEWSIRMAFQTAPRVNIGDAPDDDMSLYRLGQFALKSALPEWRINATVWPADVEPGQLTLAESVFSFGPTDYGAQSVGRWRYAEDDEVNTKTVPAIGVAEAVVRSAAAIDTNSWTSDPSLRMVASALAVNTGAHLPNPALSRRARFIHGALPLPAYFAYHHAPDVFGTHLYLTDGGHSENLGVFSLLQRRCKTIVVVDGEQDPNYQFEGYFLLKKRLKQEYGDRVTLQIDEIWRPKTEAADEAFAKLDVADIRERAANGMLICSLDGTELADVTCSPIKRRTRFSLNPVLEGQIIATDLKVRVVYAKLAYTPGNDARVGHYRGPLSEWLGNPCAPTVMDDEVADYYQCQKEKCEWGWSLSPLGCGLFPQQPTRDQNFSKPQFAAYVELGRRIGGKVAAKFPEP